MNTVAYLSFSHIKFSALLLPAELPDGYYSPGSFYLMQPDDADPDKAYIFPAVWRNQVIFPMLERRTEDYIYEVKVKQVGIFWFRVEKFKSKPPYIGSDPLLEGTFGAYRVRSIMTGRLEAACFDSDFFFVGYLRKQTEGGLAHPSPPNKRKPGHHPRLS